MSEMKQTNSNIQGYQPEPSGRSLPTPPGPRSKASVLVSVADLQGLREKFSALETAHGFSQLSDASRATIQWLDLQIAYANAPKAVTPLVTEQDARDREGREMVERADGYHLAQREHAHYFRDVSNLAEIDVYRILELFGVTDHALGHAIKKLILPGMRGAKDRSKDVKEVIDTLLRWQEMRREDMVQSRHAVAVADGRA